MGSRIKGIAIKLGGDTTGLEKALDGVNKKISSTQSELRDVEKLLKLDPKNITLLKQKQELLTKAVGDTEEKLKSLKDASEQVAKSADKYDDWKAAYEPIQDEIDQTKEKLDKLKEKQTETFDISGADSEEYKVLQEEIKDVTNALKDLKEQRKKVNEEFNNPISPEQYNRLQREIAATEISLRDLKKQSEKTDDTISKIDDGSLNIIEKAIKRVKESFQEADKEASNFGDYLKAEAIVEGAKGIIDSLKDVAEESKEYMEIMSSLEISSENAGYSAEQTAETYKQLYGVLADEQAAATTTANLQAIGLSQEELTELTNMAIGAWGKYGDSIPIDGLAEAINETVRTGQVTGNLADVLNWGTDAEEMFGLSLKENIEFTELSNEELKKLTESEKADYEAKKAQFEATEEYNQKISEAVSAEDKFNLALEEAETEADRVNLLMSALANQGLHEAGEAWRENNEALVESNEAQANLQEQTAELGEVLMPIFTEITEIVTKLLEGFNSLDENTQTLIIGAVGLVAVLGPIFSVIGSIGDRIGGLSKIMDFITKTALPALKGAFSSVFGFIAANPIVLIIAAIVGMVAAIAVAGDDIQGILQNVDDFLQNIFATDFTEIFGPVLGEALNVFFANIKNIWDSIKKVLDGIIDFVRGAFTGDWERAWNGVKKIFGGIFDGLVSLVKAPINGIIGLLNMAISAINSMISGFNSIGFDLPEWLGGGSWYPNVKTISKIAYLAEGGILNDGTAVVGEAGPEILTISGGRAIVQPLTGNAAAGQGLGELMNLLEVYLPYLAAQQQIVLDTGTLVGETAPMYNEALGEIAEQEKYR